jgi:uncharacterized protein
MVTTFFVDTSALAKRYIPEIGTSWVLSWILPPAGHVVLMAELATVEMFSLLARRQREGKLAPTQVSILQASFLLHVEEEFLVVPLDSVVLQSARQLVTRYPLRTLDAIQLASALQGVNTLNEPMTFVSADVNLLAAAAAEGFTTEDPNAHP